MDVQVKSIQPMPDPTSDSRYVFDVEMVIDGDAKMIYSVMPEALLDVSKFRVAVARETGCLLRTEQSSWIEVLFQSWNEPKPLPDHSRDLEEIAGMDNRPGGFDED